jgi:hypothetical protein
MTPESCLYFKDVFCVIASIVLIWFLLGERGRFWLYIICKYLIVFVWIYFIVFVVGHFITKYWRLEI